MRTRLRSRGVIHILASLALLGACGDDETSTTGASSGGDSSGSSGTTAGSSSTTMDTSTTSTTTGATTTGGSSGGSDGGSTGSSLDPTPGDDAYIAVEAVALTVDAAGGVLVNDTDPEGDALSVLGNDPVSAGGGIVTVDPDGGFTYTAAAGHCGEDSFGYTVGDGLGGSAVGTVELWVRPTGLGSVDARCGYVMDGPTASTSAYDVAAIGDLNGDGYGDLVIGAPQDAGRRGRVYVVFGKADMTAMSLTQAAGQDGFSIEGVSVDDFVGSTLGAGGDVNGDGLDDLVVTVEAGPRAYVVFGRTATTPVALADVETGMGGFVLDYPPAENANRHVDIVADMNGDARAEVVLGNAERDVGYVVFGKTDGAAVALPDVEAGIGGFVVQGNVVGAGLEAIASAGDVNGDNRGDIIIGAPTAEGIGRAFVVFGTADTTEIDLDALGSGGFQIDGEGYAGLSVDGAGDVNGDGFDDVVTSDVSVNMFGGRTYVVFGKADNIAVTLADVGGGLGGGFAVEATAGSIFSGWRVAGIGDFDGDGLDDIATSPAVDPPAMGAGEISVVFGRTATTPIAANDLAQGVGGFILAGEGATDYAGRRFTGSDVNGDMRSDLVVGAFRYPGGADDGRTYVVFGR